MKACYYIYGISLFLLCFFLPWHRKMKQNKDSTGMYQQVDTVAAEPDEETPGQFW